MTAKFSKRAWMWSRWRIYGVPRCWAYLAQDRICSQLVWPWQESVFVQHSLYEENQTLLHRDCATRQWRLWDEQATARLRAAA